MRRTNLSKWLRILTSKPLFLILREKAKRRRLATLKQETEIPDSQNFGEREKGKAIEQFAKAV